MKICKNCKSEVPDAFDVCWNCGNNFNTGEIEKFTDYSETQNENIIEVNCLRCNVPMKFEGSTSFHEGFNWGILGEIGHLFTSTKSFNVFSCPNCNKIEFFKQ